MQFNTVTTALHLPDSALLFSLDAVLSQFQSLTDQRKAKGLRHPLATSFFLAWCWLYSVVKIVRLPLRSGLSCGVKL